VSIFTMFMARARALPTAGADVFLHSLAILLPLGWSIAWVFTVVDSPAWRFIVFSGTALQLPFASYLATRFDTPFSPWPVAFCLFFSAAIPEWIRHRAAKAAEMELDPQFFQPAAFRPNPVAVEKSSKSADQLAPQRVGCTVLFCELVNHSSLADGLPPGAGSYFFNRLLSLYKETSEAHGGRCDRKDVEGFRAFFCTPFGIEEHPEAALHTALAIRGRVQILSQECAVQYGQELDVRIGISTGEVLLAPFGIPEGQSVGIAGENAEWAQRLAGANMLYGSRILISARTGLLGGHSVERRPIDLLQRHFPPHPPEDVFEVLALQQTLDPAALGRLRFYREGVSLFRARKWSAAREKLRHARPPVGSDEAVDMLLMRIEEQESIAHYAQSQG